MDNKKKTPEIRVCKIKIPKYNTEQTEQRFIYFLSMVLKEYYETGKINHKSSEYKSLGVVRKRLNIPGKAFDFIDLELRDKYKNLPDWVFKRYTKAEIMKECQDYIDKVKVVTE